MQSFQEVLNEKVLSESEYVDIINILKKRKIEADERKPTRSKNRTIFTKYKLEKNQNGEDILFEIKNYCSRKRENTNPLQVAHTGMMLEDLLKNVHCPNETQEHIGFKKMHKTLNSLYSNLPEKLCWAFNKFCPQCKMASSNLDHAAMDMILSLPSDQTSPSNKESSNMRLLEQVF